MGTHLQKFASKTMPAALLAAAVLLVGAVGADAQRAGAPGSDIISLNVYGGGFSPVSDLGASEFDNTGAVGGTATVWLHEYVGIRGNVLYSQTDVTGPGSGTLVGEDPDIWHYDGDLVLRLPVEAGPGGWFVPYTVGGLGAKTYDFEGIGTETEFAGNFGGGIEYRFGDTGRWGVNAEVRDFVSSFEVGGIDETQHDIVWTGGISLNF